jgi:hypothetical protein
MQLTNFKCQGVVVRLVDGQTFRHKPRCAPEILVPKPRSVSVGTLATQSRLVTL